MALTKVGKVGLKNEGAFVTRIMFDYMDDNGEKHLTRQGHDITVGFSQVADPCDDPWDVPDGATIWLYAWVVWGNDNEAKRGFTYERGNPATVNYVISGTTLNNHLELVP